MRERIESPPDSRRGWLAKAVCGERVPNHVPDRVVGRVTPCLIAALVAHAASRSASQTPARCPTPAAGFRERGVCPASVRGTEIGLRFPRRTLPGVDLSSEELAAIMREEKHSTARLADATKPQVSMRSAREPAPGRAPQIRCRGELSE
jgi:hypothetical protein